MRLATIVDGSRDGCLILVRSDGATFTPADSIAPTLQSALEHWTEREPKLRELAARLETGQITASPLSKAKLLSPLPRAYEWVDGSAFLNHVRLVRKARGAEPPPTLETDPLVYQGGSGLFLSPNEDIPLADPAWGLDFEGEICAILGDVRQGMKRSEASGSIRLFMLCNDVTLRNLIPNELAKGFGFFQSKPATAFSPFAITPDELGPAWKNGRVHLRLRCTFNGRLVGDPDAGEMHFSFFDLIEHIAKTRGFTAGTILGSGTVSNEDRARGISCLAERRMIETIESGKPITPFMKAGDTIEIEMADSNGRDLFGKISQKAVSA